MKAIRTCLLLAAAILLVIGVGPRQTYAAGAIDIRLIARRADIIRRGIRPALNKRYLRFFSYALSEHGNFSLRRIDRIAKRGDFCFFINRKQGVYFLFHIFKCHSFPPL